MSSNVSLMTNGNGVVVTKRFGDKLGTQGVMVGALTGVGATGDTSDAIGDVGVGADVDVGETTVAFCPHPVISTRSKPTIFTQDTALAIEFIKL